MTDDIKAGDVRYQASWSKGEWSYRTLTAVKVTPKQVKCREQGTYNSGWVQTWHKGRFLSWAATQEAAHEMAIEATHERIMGLTEQSAQILRTITNLQDDLQAMDRAAQKVNS
jgi:hypothetical protein